jgi:Tol biopolymer transport system component
MKTRIIDSCEFTSQNLPLLPAAPKIFRGKFVVAVWFLLLAICLLPASAAPLQLLSARNPLLPLKAGGNGDSVAPSLSPDGRFVVFSSAANDLVPGGNNYFSQNVFLRDRASNITVLVSVNLNGTGGGNGNSMLGQVSTNGQFVVFQSDATNLVVNDTNAFTDIFVGDLVAGTTTLVSVATNGAGANGASTDPFMTPDGRYVAFISRASNLVPGDTNGIPDVFVRDLVAGTNQLVSVNALFPSAIYNTFTVMATPVMTPDGRYVGFYSQATNLVSAVPSTTTGEAYVRDRLTGQTTWASTNAAAIVSALFGQTNAPSYHPRLSDDGRYVVFKTGATTSTGVAVIMQYDSVAGTTTVINTNGIGGSVDVDETYGPGMTPDGRFIAFAEHEGATNSGYSSVHVWDTQLSLDILVSDNGSGVPTNTTSFVPNLSPDGRFVAFLSNATNLVGNVVTNGFHVYLRDLQSNTTQLVDVDTNGVGSIDETLTTLSLSTDGRYVAFSSPDGGLVSSDNNRAGDVFVRDLVAATTEMVSQRDATVIPLTADGYSTLSPSSVSSDGRWVAFSSRADDLVPGDTNQALDVFVRDLVNGTNILVSVGLDGNPAQGGNSRNAVLSADGRYVVFISAATNLVAGPVNTNDNVFRRDLVTGITALVSVGTDGVSPGNGDASYPVISPDGRYVAFLSWATNLVAQITHGVPVPFSSSLNTYWRDMNLGQTVGLQGPLGYLFGPSLSDNGRYIAYAYYYYDFVSSTLSLRIWDTQLGKDIYTNALLEYGYSPIAAAIDPTGTKILYFPGTWPSFLYVDDIATHSNLFSIRTLGSIRNANCWSDDGRWLAFLSQLSNTNSGLLDPTNKVYLRDFQNGTLTFVGVAGPVTGIWPAVSDGPVMSGDGRYVAYRNVNVVTNTITRLNTALATMFLYDSLTGSNTVLTVGPAGSGPFSWVSRPAISYDGTMVAFLNLGSALVNADLNHVQDAFGASVDLNADLVDSDGDGIPDWWMMKYFGHPTGQAYDHSLASDDADGDGMSNLQEYQAGTDPTDPNSVFRLYMSGPASNTIDLSWLAAPGMKYQVQYTTNLNDPVWLTAPGTVRVLQNQGYLLTPMVLPYSFYRVFGTN